MQHFLLHFVPVTHTSLRAVHAKPVLFLDVCLHHFHAVFLSMCLLHVLLAVLNGMCCLKPFYVIVNCPVWNRYVTNFV